MRFRHGFVKIKSSCKKFVFAKNDNQKAFKNNLLIIAATDRNTNRRRVTFSGQNNIYAEDSTVGIQCHDPIPMIIIYRQGSEWI